jgi:hypothetical protein
VSTAIVIAKAPVAGRSKTRLCPPCTPAEAALLAEAALHDTLAAAAASGASRRLIALDGEPGGWLPAGFEVVPQSAGGLGARLAGAFERAGAPAFLVAMDTPQLTPGMIDAALHELGSPDTDAVLGPTRDGGYWGIGLRRPEREVFAGVPMSSRLTCSAQAQRLARLGLRTRALPALTDVDTIAEAREVAAQAPRTRFAATLRRLGHAAHEREAVAEAAA